MASNIKVALTLDDKDYQTKLKAASDATKTFGTNAAAVFVTASAGFEKLGHAAEGVKSKMESLGAAIAGIGMAEYIRRALESAAATKDLSEAFSLSIATVKELEIGFSTAGRNSDAMTRTLYSLAGSVEALKDGSPAMIDNFNKLGLSFESLKGKDTKEVMLEIARAMEKAGGSTESITAATAILGKSVKGMPWGDFIAGTERATGTMDKNAEAVESLDKTMKLLEAKTRDLMTAFQTLIKPAADLFNEFMGGANNADTAAKVLVATMAVFGAGAIVVGINAVVSAIGNLAATFGISSAATVAETGLLAANTVVIGENTAVRAAGLVAKVASLESSLANARAVLAETAAEEANVLSTAELTAARRVLMIQTSQLATAQALLADATAVNAAATGTLGAVTATAGAAASTAAAGGFAALLARFVAIAAAIAPLAVLLGGLTYSSDLNKGEDEQLAKVKKLQDALGTLSESQRQSYLGLSEAQKKIINEQLIAMTEGKKAADILAKVMGTDKKPKDNKPLITGDQKNQSAAAEESLRAQGRLKEFNLDLDLRRLLLQIDLIGKSEYDRAVQQSASDIEIKRLSEVTRLTDEITKMKAQQANDPSGGVAYAGQLKILQSQLVAVKNQTDVVTPLVARLETAKILEKDRLQQIENANRALEEQYSRLQDIGDVLQKNNDTRVDLNFQKSLKGLSDYQREVATVQENARKAALEAGRVYAAKFADSGDGLTPERAQELTQGLAAIAESYKTVAAAQIEALGSGDDLIRGLTSGWEEYKSKANDTASQIKDSFNNFTQGMEDAFVKFVQTGKLSFSDLANSILADLARVAFKKAILGIGALFGFAAGGPVMANTPIIVGERGPELFMPSSAGSIIPNNQLTNASGGGVGGQTVVNYNIQAVDAASFRSMVARDPSFIYAVTEQGRRSQPTRRAM